MDHGLLRAGEREQVERDYVAATGVRLDRRRRRPVSFGTRGVSDPEQKRKIIGREFIRVFEQAEIDLVAESAERGERIEFLVQGTLYPDVVESGGGSGTANIKSHHNVGGPPDDLEFTPGAAADAVHDEVRAVGEGPDFRRRWCGGTLPRSWTGHPDRRCRRRRTAGDPAGGGSDRARRGDPRRPRPGHLATAGGAVGGRAFGGRAGDGRTYGHPIVLRPVTSDDAMTADWSRLPHDVIATISTRITNEVPEVNRVVLDVTSKPPAPSSGNNRSIGAPFACPASVIGAAGRSPPSSGQGEAAPIDQLLTGQAVSRTLKPSQTVPSGRPWDCAI